MEMMWCITPLEPAQQKDTDNLIIYLQYKTQWFQFLVKKDQNHKVDHMFVHILKVFSDYFDVGKNILGDE